MVTQRTSKTFKEWLQADEPLIVAEGYLLEFDRRGYLQAGDFIPEVVLEHPKLVKQMHREFAHAGSDVTLAFTYYCHRKKLERIGRLEEVEKINRTALTMAKEVAQETGTFFAGGICNTNIMTFDGDAEREIRAMYEEQVFWAKEAGVEFIIAESLNSSLEANIAISVTKKHNLPVVVTFNLYRDDATVLEGMSAVEARKAAEEAGADVVGFNCGRGPQMIVPLMRELRAACKGPLAALPVCYRTTEANPSWMHMEDPLTGVELYPKDISAASSCPSDIERFAEACELLGFRYAGLCCGNSGALTRTLAMHFGRSPPAARFACNQTQASHHLWKSNNNNKEEKD